MAEEFLKNNVFPDDVDYHGLLNDGLWTNNVLRYMRQFAKQKCKEQREICAEKATTFSDVGGTFVDTDSILNAPEPEF